MWLSTFLLPLSHPMTMLPFAAAFAFIIPLADPSGSLADAAIVLAVFFVSLLWLSLLSTISQSSTKIDSSLITYL